MTTGIVEFPQTLPSQTFVGNPRSVAGQAEAIPFAAFAPLQNPYLGLGGGVANVLSFAGVDPTGATDSTTGINNAITAALLSDRALYFPAGTYLVSSSLTTITGQFTLFGDGPQQTTFMFNTSAPLALFTLSNGAAQTLHVVMSGFGITSTDTTHANIGIDCYDINTCAFRDLYVHGSRNASPGGAAYFGGTGSIAFRVQGRDACNFHNIQANADYIYYVGANPNSAATNCEDMDHFSFTGYQYLNPVSQYAITVADGHGITNATWGPDLAVVGGLGVFKINDTRVAPTVSSRNIRFCGGRGEQATASSGYWFNTSFATRCQTLTIEDFLGDSTTQGILSDKVLMLNLIGTTFARGSGDGIKVTSPDADSIINMIGCQWQNGSNFTLTNYTPIISIGNAGDFAGPMTAVYSGAGLGTGSISTGHVTASVASNTSGLDVSALSGGDRFQVYPQVANSGVILKAENDGKTDFEPFGITGSTFTFNYRTGVGTSSPAFSIGTDGAPSTAAVRFKESQGAVLTAANNLALGADGNYFQVNGATQINLIVNTNWQGGSEVTLKFNSTPVVKHNQATSGANVKIILNGAVDFTAAANNLLTLRYDSTDVAWYEQSRKV